MLRLAHSPHRNQFVLKGGVLLAAYGLRRPTADIDGAALQTPSDVENIRQFVADVASTTLPAGLDDGLMFDLGNVTAEAIREEDKYSGVRVRLVSHLASAREPFHVDVSTGDPILPGPAEVLLPRLLGQEPISLRGYPIEMVLAEKVVTALERGSASTRWRDFGDIFVITGRRPFSAGDIRHAFQAVAGHRHVELASIDDALDGYAEIGQPRWASWRRRLQLTETLPEDFGQAVESMQAFANPIITRAVNDLATWDPGRRAWNRTG